MENPGRGHSAQTDLVFSGLLQTKGMDQEKGTETEQKESRASTCLANFSSSAWWDRQAPQRHGYLAIWAIPDFPLDGPVTHLNAEDVVAPSLLHPRVLNSGSCQSFIHLVHV